MPHGRQLPAAALQTFLLRDSPSAARTERNQSIEIFVLPNTLPPPNLGHTEESECSENTVFRVRTRKGRS
jgi:hypothetical protein